MIKIVPLKSALYNYPRNLQHRLNYTSHKEITLVNTHQKVCFCKGFLCSFLPEIIHTFLSITNTQLLPDKCNGEYLKVYSEA